MNSEELIAKIKAEQTAPSAEKSSASADANPQPSATAGNSAPTSATQETSEPKPSSSQSSEPQKNVNAATPQEKRDFAFRRRLEKHDAELRAKFEADAKKRDEEWEAKLKALESKLPKEAPKTIKDFANADEYVQYLAKQQSDAAIAKYKSEIAEKQKEIDEEAKKREDAEREQTEILNAFQSYANTAFGGDEQKLTTFYAKVRKANEHGLGAILDADPVSSKFLLGSPDGVKVLEAIIDDVNNAKRIFGKRDPLDRALELRAMARELATPAQQTLNLEQPKAQKLPNVGTPGAGGNPGRKDIFKSRDSLRDYLKKRELRYR